MSLEKERVEALQRVIDELRDEPGALMPIMQRAQDIFGYLPEDVAEVHRQGNGYSGQRRLTAWPRSTRSSTWSRRAVHHQRVHGHGLLRQRAAGRCWISRGGGAGHRPPGTPRRTDCLPLNACRCLGACGLAPVMMINEDVYGRLTPDEIPGIIAKVSR